MECQDEELANTDKDHLNQSFLVGLLKYSFPGSTHGDSDSVGLGWDFSMSPISMSESFQCTPQVALNPGWGFTALLRINSC